LTTDRTLISVRERGFLDLLDLGLVVIRGRPVTLALAALAGIVPFELLNYGVLAAFDIGAMWPVCWFVLVIWEAPLALAPLTVVLGDMMFGKRPSPVRVLQWIARGLPALIAYQVVMRAVLLLPPLIPLIPARMSFVTEVILLERSRLTKVSERSAQLSRGRGGDLFGRWIAQVAFGVLFVLGFWYASEKLGQTLVREWTWEAPEWSGVLAPAVRLGIWLSLAYFSVVRFLTYIDQRIRLEGWEIDLRLRAMGAALEDQERW
jgi:hypothetical protein